MGSKRLEVYTVLLATAWFEKGTRCGGGIFLVLKPNETFLYDYMETYWVVDEDKFQKQMVPNVPLAVPSESNRILKNIMYSTIKKVPCTDWHFYLCKKMFKPQFQSVRLQRTTKSHNKL
ncbi:hypothetical protein Ocin01_14297 [Orchesella cincta]|uniref:Uncharacterized protein n=1 Tax=Orchesella cincta TaxID=48709 RepID=A0A1D2MHI2_ORCCI|nr:hypothetical protein Ocin01_14297 [Orchesella cincta]